MTPAQIAREAYNEHRASQRVGELTAAVELVAGLDPTVIVEIGCDAGGTLWCWRQLCDEVYGITLADNSRSTGGQGYRLVDHGAAVLVGDSHDRASLAWLVRQLHGRPVDVLFVDGDHSYAGVRADLEMYGPLVRPGGLILLHDIANVRDSRVEVPRLWRELAAAVPGCREIVSERSPAGFGVLTIPEEGLQWPTKKSTKATSSSRATRT